MEANKKWNKFTRFCLEKKRFYLQVGGVFIYLEWAQHNVLVWWSFEWCWVIFATVEMISRHTSLSVIWVDVIWSASKDNDLIIHANEEVCTLPWIRMWWHTEEVVLASISWNLWHVEFAGLRYTRSAENSLSIENISSITWEVNTSSNHAHEEVLACTFYSPYTEEFLAAVNFLCTCWCERKCDQSQSNICKWKSFAQWKLLLSHPVGIKLRCESTITNFNHI